MKIFLDANIFIAATGNTTGGSHYIFSIAQVDPAWQLLTNEYALREAKINILKKMSENIDTFLDIISARSLTLIQSSPQQLIQKCEEYIIKKDAPILAGAIFSKSDYLCTFDRKDFSVSPIRSLCKKFGIIICEPKNLINFWRKNQKRKA